MRKQSVLEHLYALRKSVGILIHAISKQNQPFIEYICSTKSRFLTIDLNFENMLLVISQGKRSFLSQRM